MDNRIMRLNQKAVLFRERRRKQTSATGKIDVVAASGDAELLLIGHFVHLMVFGRLEILEKGAPQRYLMPDFIGHCRLTPAEKRNSPVYTIPPDNG